jgi:hypothetical protein
MTNCNTKQINFLSLGNKKISGSFTGGSITSDGGLLLLREVDKKLQLTSKMAKLITEKRDKSYIEHQALQLLRQRVFAIAAGYEDFLHWYNMKRVHQRFNNKQTPFEKHLELTRK